MGNVPADETFEGSYPFKPHFSDAPGFRMHYVDEGEGDPVVLVHGFPTWSYLYRAYIPVLARRHRVIAPDNMGYGKSHSPKGEDYSFAGHSRKLEALLLDLDLRDITLVLHDIGGPIGAGFAFRNHERIRRIVLQNTVMLGIDPRFEVEVMTGGTDNVSPYLQWIAGKHREGDFLPLYDNIDTTLPSLFKSFPLFWRAPLTTLLARAYCAPWREREHRAAAMQMARLVYVPVVEGRGVADFILPTPEQAAAIRKKPVMMMCGMRDMAVEPSALLKIFRRQFPAAPLVELAETGHFLQEDSAEAAVSMIDLFMQMS